MPITKREIREGREKKWGKKEGIKVKKTTRENTIGEN